MVVNSATISSSVSLFSFRRLRHSLLKCSLATSSALVLLEPGYRAKELYGGIEAWETLRMPEGELGHAANAA
jgi:hypothetical protein